MGRPALMPAARCRRPAHHKLEQFIDEYLAAAGIREDGKSPLFRSAIGKTGVLTDKPMNRIDAYRMVRRRTAEAGFKVKLGCHVFRATGITAYLEAGGTLENAQAMAAHESPRTTKLYDRTGGEITLDPSTRWSELQFEAAPRYGLYTRLSRRALANPPITEPCYWSGVLES
jgi:integrase